MAALIGFDLDDTLYPESMYVRSGQEAVAADAAQLAGADAAQLYGLMVAAPSPAEGFERLHDFLADKFGINMDVERMVSIYRSHKPRLSLEPAHAQLLDSLARRGHTLVLISDGDFSRQMAKIEGLGLDRWFGPRQIIIGTDRSNDKLSGIPFAEAERRFDAARRYYIADNPAKDFLWPNRRGWHSVMLLHSTPGVHKQNFNDLPPQMAPHTVINTLTQLTKFTF